MSNAVTSSVALTELKNNLTNLSKSLHNIYDLMNTDMRQIGEAWQDGKYQEFVEGYKPQIDKCEEISVRYNDWCQRVLNPTIENVIAVERTDVGSGSGAAVRAGASSAGTMNGAGATGAAMGATSGKVGGFNMGGNQSSNQDTATPKRIVPRPTADISRTNNNVGNKGSVQSGPVQLEKSYTSSQSTVKNVFDQADEICKTNNRSDKFRAKLAKPEDAEFTLSSRSSETGSGFSAGGDVKVGAEMPLFKVAKASVNIEGEGKYDSGRESSEITANYPFRCDPI
jgi:hypothetical protein